MFHSIYQYNFFGTALLNIVIFSCPAECFLQLMPSKTSEVVQYPIPDFMIWKVAIISTF
jgi:hypothetical protein